MANVINVSDRGENGTNGITPHIGDNGNWFIRDTDTRVKAIGENGKSAYDYAKNDGFSGTEEEFIEKISLLSLMTIMSIIIRKMWMIKIRLY